MADFYQTGMVTTLHSLSRQGLPRLEAELEGFAERRPIGLVLPALYAEFETPAMQRIVRELRSVRYLRRIVMALARADRRQYERAVSFFEDFETPVTCLWIDSPRTQRLFRLLEETQLPAGQDGKGRSCWLAYGYLLARGDCDVIALHDCDILNYNRCFLARLCYPVANPNLGFEFCKGYYARVTNRMHGRATRLLLTPLVRAMTTLAPGVPLLGFLDSFRYALAGEFAMRANLARVNRIPGDWGLEVGVLAEIYRNCAVSRVCQVDLADNYDHKHQELSANDGTRGLRRMATDIAKCLFRTLAAEGVVFGEDHFRTLRVHYQRMAQDTIARYYADAQLNGLEFDRHAEELAVATFVRSVADASDEFLEDPLGIPAIPNWNRVVAAIPDFLAQLLESVEEDAWRPRATVAVPA